MPTHRLWERESELARLEELLDLTAGGAGAVALLDGPAGIGKTTLLDALRELADARGARVIAAQAQEIERSQPFAVVRRLLGTEAVTAHDGEERSYALLESLRDRVGDLASAGRLVVVLDDAHAADAASLRFLLHLARHLQPLSALVAVAMRPAPVIDVLERLRAEPLCHVIRPRPLSLSAVRELVDEALPDADPDFAASCHAVTAGNPYMLRQLLRAVSDAEVQPDGDSTRQLAVFGAQSADELVAHRVRGLGPAAARLARAVAVLGPDAHVRHAAALAGLTFEEALTAADELVGADVLRDERPLAFVHPLMQAAAYAELPRGARALKHAEAATLLASEGAGADRIGAHLLHTEPAGDPDRAVVLRRAAAMARSVGAPEVAGDLLKRALDEPPRVEERGELLTELGIVSTLAGNVATATEALRQAFDHATATGGDRVTPAIYLRGISYDAQVQAQIVDPLIAELSVTDPGVAAQLEAMVVIGALMLSPVPPDMHTRVVAFRDRWLEDADAPDPFVSAVAAALATFSNAPSSRAAAAAERAVEAAGQGRFDLRGGGGHLINALIYNDRFESAATILDDAIARARRDGSVTVFVNLALFRARLNLRLGRLAAAEADARGVLETAGLLSPAAMLAQAVAVLVEVMRERGAFDEAEALLVAQDLHERDFPTLQGGHLLHARGRLRVGQGRIELGLSDLLACGDHETSVMCNPSVRPWRSDVALATQTRDAERARQLADEELELARAFGAPRCLGISLRAHGLVTGGDQGIAELEESVAQLAGSDARLEHAHSLVALGGALRRGGRRADARAPLREGLDLAVRCEAGALVARARAELASAGARPRRDLITGRDALTPSEQRVAELAATGMTNREVAQTLFLSAKTVDNHLSRIYGKLGINSRAALAEALTPGGVGS